MTRGRPAEAPDLHDRFGAWLQAGAPGEPARDVAVHAAHCQSCRALIAAWDELALVDTGRAPMPPSRGVLAPAARPRVGRRALAATAAALLVVAGGAWIGATALRPADIGRADGSPTPDQGVLGGFGAGGTASPTAQGSLGAGDTGSPTDSPTASPGTLTPTPDATQDVPAPVPTATPRLVTPAPTARPTASTAPPNPTQTIAPPSATPNPTPVATPEPTAEPTAEPSTAPTPSPVPDDCEDGVDNDGDSLIDVLDPGCLLDGNEASA